MMMSDLALPEDLEEEVMSRVPATSLKRLRSTCKRWDALFKEPRFRKKHFDNAAKQFEVVMLKKNRICSMSVNLNVAPPSIVSEGELGLKDIQDDQQVDIAQVCHCDGLLLCTTQDKRLAVWNPCLAETRWIHYDTTHYALFALGYGEINNKSCGRSYKILRYYWWPKYEPDQVVYEGGIYDFSSDSWRFLSDMYTNCTIVGHGSVSLKGNTYWLASDKTHGVVDACTDFLLCFDYTRERFRRLCLPQSENRSWMALSVVREEQLAVLHELLDTSELEIWLTNNKFDTSGGGASSSSLLWSKSFTVRFQIQDFASLLIYEEKKVALLSVIHNGDQGHVFTIGEDDEYLTMIHFWKTKKQWIFNYVPSLVQIHQDI